MLGNNACFFVTSADFFQNQHFQKILSGLLSGRQTGWTQIRPDIYVGPDQCPNCLKRLTADGLADEELTFPAFH